jgi:hypothetical protein
LSDETAGGRDHEKVEKDLEKPRRRAPTNKPPPKELRETPPSGAEPSEGEEVWLDGKDAQPPVEERPWWRRLFGG